MGDSKGYALHPGAARGFVTVGLSPPPMSTGGFVAELVLSLTASSAALRRRGRPDAPYDEVNERVCYGLGVRCSRFCT